MIAGQGTIGLELLEQCPQTRSGRRSRRRRRIDRRRGLRHQGTAARGESRRRADRAPAFDGRRRWRSTRRSRFPAPSTIADGIAVRRAGDVTYPLVAKYVDEMVTVEEEEIASAILTLLEREKMLAEGAGAAATAALLQHKTKLDGQHTAVLVGGGNIDVSLLSRIIERGLVKDGRLVRIRIYLPDRPGALAELSSVIAGQKGQYRRAAVRPRLLRRQPGRHRHRRHARNARRRTTSPNCWRPSAAPATRHERILVADRR